MKIDWIMFWGALGLGCVIVGPGSPTPFRYAFLAVAALSAVMLAIIVRKL